MPRQSNASVKAPADRTKLALDSLGLSGGQSIELLKALHILTRDGAINQDSRRKLKQVLHLFQFIEPLLTQTVQTRGSVTLVDHGAGKSYLGFILYDLFLRPLLASAQTDAQLATSCFHSIETRGELVSHAQQLAQNAGFTHMAFHALSVAESITSPSIPSHVDVVTALHACNTATDDAIDFALAKRSHHLVLVPCCQAEVAATLRAHKGDAVRKDALSEIWRHPLHTREFGSQITNVLRCLRLEAHGYKVTVTELVGWEHSMKNELIIASHTGQSNGRAAKRLEEILTTFGLDDLKARFG
jgi:hypothetical protein